MGRVSCNWHLASPLSSPHQWVSQNITLSQSQILTEFSFPLEQSEAPRQLWEKKKTCIQQFKPDKSESSHSLATTLPCSGLFRISIFFLYPLRLGFFSPCFTFQTVPKVQTSCSSFPTCPNPRVELPLSSQIA